MYDFCPHKSIHLRECDGMGEWSNRITCTTRITTHWSTGYCSLFDYYAGETVSVFVDSPQESFLRTSWVRPCEDSGEYRRLWHNMTRCNCKVKLVHNIGKDTEEGRGVDWITFCRHLHKQSFYDNVRYCNHNHNNNRCHVAQQTHVSRIKIIATSNWQTQHSSTSMRTKRQ